MSALYGADGRPLDSDRTTNHMVGGLNVGIYVEPSLQPQPLSESMFKNPDFTLANALQVLSGFSGTNRQIAHALVREIVELRQRVAELAHTLAQATRGDDPSSEQPPQPAQH